MAAAQRWPWHEFSFRGRHYLVNGETGVVHLLDEAAAAAWEVLLDRSTLGPPDCAYTCSIDQGQEPGQSAEQVPDTLVSRFGRAVATEAWQEVCTLVRAVSCSESCSASPSKAQVKPGASPEAGSWAEPEPIRIGTPLKALCLLVAMDCNLACRYCFAAPDWHARGPRRMPLTVACRAIDFLIEASGASRFLQIDFFGGEPTLNLEVVREATAYAQTVARQHDKQVNFTLTTNALIWSDEIADFLNEHHFQVILSLDGRPEVHDRLRRRAGDQPSHALVLRNVTQAVASLVDQNYWVRGTFTRFNLDFASDVEYLVKHGFRQISFEPVVDLPDRPWALQEEDLPRLLAEYERLAELYLEQAAKGDPFEFFHFRLAPPSGPCVARRISGCGAGYQYLAVTPEGELYPCHQFVGRDAYRLGSIFDPDAVQRFSPDGGCTLSERFRRTHAQSKPECRRCWAKLYCGGGCHANADLLAGDIAATLPLFCTLQKKRVELSIALRTEIELMKP
ncbi:MAG: thioether cross-link-forming SCIFF peptide maturase [Limnochordales bacterium]|nr:thioether cross-link-forming SCIFF peptide maturase [Limnochordales bacterium]